jgi:hypothetical protein
MTQQHKPFLSYKLALIAGIVGGAIETVWLWFLSQIMPLDLHEVARQTTLSLYVFSGKGTWLVPLGIAIHAAISIAVGMAFAYVVNKSPATMHKLVMIPVLSIGFLLFIWLMNFAFILPVLNPTFLTLIPFTATLMSKILFGCGMGITFLWVKEFQTARLSKPAKPPKQKNRSSHIFPLI